MTPNDNATHHRGPYHKRHAMAVAESATLTIYVPIGPSAIAPRSGVVGELEGDRVLVHYEGWLYGAAQYEHLDDRGKWAAGVEHAAGRAFVQYPTIAKAWLEPATLLPVGTITASGTLTIDDEEAVTEWLNR